MRKVASLLAGALITAFFAAVVGFGLKHILDGEVDGDGPHSITTHKWAYFIVTTLLFLRYLLGSANHLWVEHVRPNTGSSTKLTKWLILKDVSFLLVFGYLAALMCYSDTPLQFFRSGIYLILAAFAWSAIDAMRWIRNRRPVGQWWAAAREWWAGRKWASVREWWAGKWWAGWLVLDLIHIGAFLIALKLHRLGVGGPGFTTWSWSLILLVSATVVIFALDYLLQLLQVEQVSKPQDANGTRRGEERDKLEQVP